MSAQVSAAPAIAASAALRLFVPEAAGLPTARPDGIAPPIMHDIKAIRADGPAFDAALARRGVAAGSADILDWDTGKRLAQTALEEAVAQQSEIGRAIGKAKATKDEASAPELMQRASALKMQIEQLELAVPLFDPQLEAKLFGLPNLPAPEVPDGLDEHGNVAVHERGTKPAFDFAPVEHDALAVRLGYDPDAAAAIAGARFAVLKGPLARLHRALGQWMLDMQVGNGYTEVNPPLLVLE